MNKILKITALSILSPVIPVSAGVMVAPEVTLSPSGISVSWQGKGTLFSSNAPAGGIMVEEAGESPYA
ncbi:MAG: hypothetical protein AB3N33_13165, partial [Puniceicoccaceae bacterium]